MKLLNPTRIRILVAVLLGIGLTSMAKADVCYYDANGLTYRGEILATYSTAPASALVHWETINGSPVLGKEERIPFYDLTNCGGVYIQFFPYVYHPYYVGYRLGYTYRVYDRGYYPSGSHRYVTRITINNRGPVVIHNRGPVVIHNRGPVVVPSHRPAPTRRPVVIHERPHH